MDFFHKEEGVQLIDIAPADRQGTLAICSSKVKGVMFWQEWTAYALHHPKMAPDGLTLPFAVEKIGKFLDHKISNKERVVYQLYG